MEISSELVSEARRLLRLARDDRRAAEGELARLPPETQAAVVCEASLSIRRQVIELLPEPEAVVPLLPEAELCYTCRHTGLEDAGWLLPLATTEQLVACLDLDAWSGLTIDPSRLDEWITALATGEEESLLRVARGLDPELLTIYLRQHVEVYVKPSPQDDPDWTPPDRSQTLEGQFYFVARNPKDDLAPLLVLLHTLFRGDYWLYFRTIQAVREELPTDNQEWALRWRTGRLEDLGFPAWDAAMRIYGFLRPDRRSDLPADEAALDVDREALPVWVSQLPGEQSDERALFRATRELEEGERSALFHALIGLANRVAVADRMALGDPDSLPRAIDKATRFASEGLVYVAEKNGVSLVAALRRAPLERLFRVGINLDPDSGLPPPIASEDPTTEGDVGADPRGDEEEPA